MSEMFFTGIPGLFGAVFWLSHWRGIFSAKVYQARQQRYATVKLSLTSCVKHTVGSMEETRSKLRVIG